MHHVLDGTTKRQRHLAAERIERAKVTIMIGEDSDLIFRNMEPPGLSVMGVGS